MTRLLLVGVFVLLASLVAAQQLLYVGPTTAESPRMAKASDFDGSILFCRGHYTSSRTEENGSGWWTDYPGADHNFLVRLSELTEVRVRFDRNRQPFYVVVGLHDPLLFKCPILFMEDVGTIDLQDREVPRLRSYFAKGGFLWVDDFWGSKAWEQWDTEIRRVLPSATYPMIDLADDHPIFHQLYDIQGGIWQMPTIGIWTGVDCAPEDTSPCGDHVTSERGADSAEPHIRGILDADGRVIVLMTHNTDIADGFEEEGKPENVEYMNTFSARSYALGVNVFVYALSH